MDDLTITRLCAEAMGYTPIRHPNGKLFPDLLWTANGENWNPLKDDAQAMRLLKQFSLHMPLSLFNSVDINRTICETVAKMQAAKGEK